MFAEVIVDINHTNVDKVFDYQIVSFDVKIGSRVVVPFGNKNVDGIVIKIKNTTNYDKTKIKNIIGILDDIPVMTEETVALSEFIADTCFVTRAAALRLFLPSEMRKGKVREQLKKYLYLNKNENIDEIIASLRKNAIKQKNFLIYLKKIDKVGYTEAILKFGISAVKTVIDKGFIRVAEEQVFRLPYENIESTKKEINLTEIQKEAINTIDNSKKMTTLIFGVTGSGKTEIYLELIERIVKKGKTAILLVPEISLTPQMLKQLRARFHEKAAILHSGLSAGERFDEWWRLRSGEAQIAIGARSAIFAPVDNLGLIIVDEEHDESYISEVSPRYSTINVAKFRAGFFGAKIVLGSATPSLESFLQVEKKTYDFVKLNERINKKPLPSFEIVDMKKEVKCGNNTIFSGLLKTEIKRECVDKGNQAILFLNQRGYSRTVICTECGHVIKCKNCDVSLTYHKEDSALLCHYCGAKFKMITACPECGSKFIKFGGVGTERVVDELKKIFPDLNILRMDRDTTQNKNRHLEILDKFSKKEANVLVGTQMIAKGHDFPFVTLVGILDADMSLHFSDYRSEERTFALLTQVAGRCGRAEESGKVILQTYSPENPVLSFAFNYNYEKFYKREISIRSATGFPPFVDIVRVLLSSENEKELLNATKTLYTELFTLYNENKSVFKFFGCMKAPLKKLQGKFRYQILMRINIGHDELIKKIYYSANKYNSRDILVYLEINPNNLT